MTKRVLRVERHTSAEFSRLCVLETHQREISTAGVEP